MPTRIVLTNGEQVLVTPEIEQVAEAVARSGLARLERPWGDTPVYVNASAIAYMEAQQERASEIETLDQTAGAPTPATQRPAPVPQGPHPGAPPHTPPPPGGGVA